MIVLRWTVPLVVALMVLAIGGPSAPAEAMPFPPSRIGTSADYQGFINGRFLILNMHGGFLHPSIDPVQENIRYAAWMNAGAQPSMDKVAVAQAEALMVQMRSQPAEAPEAPEPLTPRQRFRKLMKGES